MTLSRPLQDWKLWLLGAVAGLLLLAAMAPAKAAACNSPIAKKQSGDPSFACITTRSGVGPSLDFCDRDPDSHYVYARFVDSVYTGKSSWASTAGFGFPKGYDGNGYASGCGHLSLLSGRFYAWMVCIQAEGCSGWAYYPPPPPGIWARRW